MRLLIILILQVYIFGYLYSVETNYEFCSITESDLLFYKNNNPTIFDILLPDYNHNFLVPYKFLEDQKNSYIVFVKDHNDNHYVVKQEKDASLHKQFGAISEALSAYIANVLSVSAQKVQIIPANIAFPGKFMTHRVATLHSYVPGNTIRSIGKSPYRKLDIKQTVDPHVPRACQGFNERVIYWMAQHSDLPGIVALDTFLNNDDRNKANLIFDSESDSFYAIDMALMYKTSNNKMSVVDIACEQVLAMVNSKKVFIGEELEALRIYRDTLKKLIQLFPPKKMCALLDIFFIESGIVETFFVQKKEMIAILYDYKKVIKQSYVASKKLLYLLYLLIDH